MGKGKAKTRKQHTLKVQIPIISQFGYEASEEGVMQSVMAFGPLNFDPEIAQKNTLMQQLINPQLIEKEEVVVVDIGGALEEVTVNERMGPKVLQLDGTHTFFRLTRDGKIGLTYPYGRPWDMLTSTEQNVQLQMVAKKNRFLRNYERGVL